MKRITVLVVLGMMLSVAACADDGKAGYAGSFLQVPIGARPTAMGGAYIGVSNDGAGVLFNPAGLTSLAKPLFGTSYRFLQLDRKLGYVTALFPVRGNSVLGGHLLYAGSGSVAARDKDGDLLGRDIAQNDYAFSILFAKRFENYVSAGMKLTYMHSTLSELSSFSVGVNAGAMLYLNQLIDREKRDRFPLQDFQVGAVVKNLGGKYLWNSEKLPSELGGSAYGYEQQDKVPVEFGIGTSARILSKKLLLAADGTKNTKENMVFRAGVEYNLVQQFALRAGYGDKRLTAGTGYVFAFGKKQLAIDYAFSTDRADEGSEHIFSFDFLF